MGTGDEGPSTEHVILVVEDDPDQDEALAMLLGTRGYAVTVAASGTEALAVLAAGFQPCLLVLDLGLRTPRTHAGRRGRILDRLKAHFGQDNVFMDVDGNNQIVQGDRS